MNKEYPIHRAETIRPRSNKFQQEPLPLGGREKTEDLKWTGYVEGDRLPGSSGEREAITLGYDNGECTMDGVVVNFQDIIRAIGPNLGFYKKDAVFRKIYEKETGKKIGD